MREFLHVLCVCVFLTFFLACASSDKPEKSDLIDNWVVVGATRDGRATETLNGAYFKFSDDVLETNFMGEEMRNNYVLKNHNILIGKERRQYQIEYIDPDSLHLSVEIKGYPFHFFLHKESNTK